MSTESDRPSQVPLSRFEALRAVASAYPTEPVVVALGTMVREMLLVGRRDNHLYVLDSMGLPPAIGLGLALAPACRRFDKVVTIEGDGGLLMGFSTLATIGALRPERLLLVVLDNGAYAATGMQRTAAPAVDLCAAARACGLQAFDVDQGGRLEAVLRECRHLPGPIVVRVAIGPQNREAPYFLPDPVELTLAFQRYLAGPAAPPAQG
ncbi:MAG TPA: thiamine pyrophosphate-dependent enzyme [Chloroflexota bacterium]|jgi:sulfopyruvate decarboxylase subunit beta|nr:thiamine pyrophosphate-dependent enzyme [Chloroflexota bacterium]